MVPTIPTAHFHREKQYCIILTYVRLLLTSIRSLVSARFVQLRPQARLESTDNLL